jgi:hypothetical protein
MRIVTALTAVAGLVMASLAVGTGDTDRVVIFMGIAIVSTVLLYTSYRKADRS